MNQIGEVLAKQYESVWSMLEKTIANTPDDRWHQGVGEWFFSLTVYHVIETAEFYTLNDPKEMTWGARAGFQWNDVKKIETDVLPKITIDLITSYLKDVKANLEKRLHSFTEEEYHKGDGFENHLKTRFEKFIYLLRHCGHHIGELNRALREWNCTYSHWE